MAGERLQTLWTMAQPRIVFWGGIGIGAVATYDSFSNQFPSWYLPKLGNLLPGWSGMTGALLPWWGWLLVLQTVFLYALFEYVRKAVRPPIGDAALKDIQARLSAHEERQAKWGEITQALRSDHSERIDGVIKSLADLKNAEDARLAQISLKSEQTQGYFNMLKADDLDLRHVLHFGILEATLAYLEGLVEESPKAEIPLGDEVADGARKEMYSLHRGYVQKALGNLDGDRYSRAYSVISNAEHEAEEHVRAMECPPHINLLDLRRYEIARFQTMRMLAFLQYECREVTGKIRMGRSQLLERYQAREKERR